MSHTPGPWVVDDEAQVFGANVLVASTSEFDNWETRDANARLIAAAPDLLAAVLVVAEDRNAVNLSAHGSGLIRAAIAKATGGSMRHKRKAKP